LGCGRIRVELGGGVGGQGEVRLAVRDVEGWRSRWRGAAEGREGPPSRVRMGWLPSGGARRGNRG